MIKTLLSLSVSLLTCTVWADGQLSFILKTREGFQKFEVTEKLGVRDGKFISGFNSMVLKTFRDRQFLVMDVNGRRDYLEVSSIGTTTRYFGPMWDMLPSEILAYPRANEGFLIKGDIVGTKFQVEADPKKKTMFMEWDKLTLNIVADKTTPGSCKGVFAYDDGTDYEELGTFTCKSTGTLTDALFKSQADVISSVVHMFVLPPN